MNEKRGQFPVLIVGENISKTQVKTFKNKGYEGVAPPGAVSDVRPIRLPSEATYKE